MSERKPLDSKDHLWLFLSIPVGAAGLAVGVNEALLEAGVQEFLPAKQPYALAGVVGFIPAWMLTAICFRQKNTYDASIYEKRPGCIVPAWMFFLSMMLGITGFVFGAPTVVMFRSTILCAADAAHHGTRIWAGLLLPFTLMTSAISLSGLSRALWIWSMGRQIDRLATSTVRGAAHGLVELKGTAHPVDPERTDQPIFTEDSNAGPFLLEDATGRVLVEPPRVKVWTDPRIALNLHSHTGLPTLRSGDEVLVIGRLQEDPARPGQIVVRGWTPPELPFGRLLLSRGEIFLLVGGGEAGAKARLFKARLGWIALGSVLSLGSLLVVAIALAGLIRPSLLTGFSTFRP